MTPDDFVFQSSTGNRVGATDCGGPIREGEPIKRESKEDAWVHDNCDLAVYLREEV